MAEMRASPVKSQSLKRLADIVRSVEQGGEMEFLPFNPMSLFPVSSTTLENLAYGNLPFSDFPSVTNRRLPVIKTGREQEVAELASLLPVVPPSAKVASRAVTRGANYLGDVLTQAVTRNPQATSMRALDEISRMSPFPQITVYHGSPYLFRQLDPSKVGTGEGAQAYGHGAGYTAQVRDVAESYTPRDYEYEDALQNLYKQAERRQDYGSMEVLESAMMHKRPAELRQQFGAEADDTINQIAALENRSYLYKGEIPDKILPKFLDWDLEISKQSKEVQDLAKKLGLEPTDLGGDLVAKVGKDAAGSKVMEDAGIKGIKYYDGNSRNAQYGSQNYIPFSPEDFEIEEINDIPLSEFLNQGFFD
jgi:hypothetical protein